MSQRHYHLKIILAHTLEKGNLLTIDELALALCTDVDVITSLIEYHIIHPRGKTLNTWRFGSEDLSRAKRAIILQKDLEINLMGIGIILDLLDEVKILKEEVDFTSKSNERK